MKDFCKKDYAPLVSCCVEAMMLYPMSYTEWLKLIQLRIEIEMAEECLGGALQAFRSHYEEVLDKHHKLQSNAIYEGWFCSSVLFFLATFDKLWKSYSSIEFAKYVARKESLDEMTESQARKVWDKYRNVAPLWASYRTLREFHDSSLKFYPMISDIDLSLFLDTAQCYAEILSKYIRNKNNLLPFGLEWEPSSKQAIISVAEDEWIELIESAYLPKYQNTIAGNRI